MVGPYFNINIWTMFRKMSHYGPSIWSVRGLEHPYRYPPRQANSRDKQMGRRARGLPTNYRGKLCTIHQQYYHSADGYVGPCQARLESLGDLLQLVVGAF